jgi:hypothetical protein
MARTLAELSPEIDQGRVSVRVLVTHRPDSQGGANGARVIYAAGLHDERAFADTLLAMFRSQESVLATTDADVTGLVRAIPSSFPMETAIRILDARQQDVAQLLDDAVRERSRLGVVAEPTLILEDRADSTRRRTFPGYAATDVVRLAITDLSSPRRPSAP